MSSLFDSNVYARRNHTPWASMSFLQFAREVCLQDTRKDAFNDPEQGVVMTIKYRPDVASRYWYELSWTASDGERRTVSAQEFDLCLWRAAQVELDVRAREERKEQVQNREQKV